MTEKLPLEALVHREVYHDYDKEAIDRLYASKEQSEETCNILKENELPNLAQVFTKKRYVKKDNEYFATVLADALKKQGF